MTLTHSITIQSHADNKTDHDEIYNDGTKFKINMPAGEGHDRVFDAVFKLAYVL